MAKALAAGDLRERVTLSTRSLTPDAGTGGLTEAFAGGDSVWAAVEAISGGRFVAAVQVETVATHRVTIRYRADYAAVKWIAWRGTKLRVHSVRVADDRRRFVEFLAEEARDA